ncbi:MAG: Serine phosphatase RsbU, regulator of sigma subunit, partial [uncultured Phycisphaerae bacterium]
VPGQGPDPAQPGRDRPRGPPGRRVRVRREHAERPAGAVPAGVGPGGDRVDAVGRHAVQGPGDRRAPRLHRPRAAVQPPADRPAQGRRGAGRGRDREHAIAGGGARGRGVGAGGADGGRGAAADDPADPAAGAGAGSGQRVRPVQRARRRLLRLHPAARRQPRDRDRRRQRQGRPGQPDDGHGPGVFAGPGRQRLLPVRGGEADQPDGLPGRAAGRVRHPAVRRARRPQPAVHVLQRRPPAGPAAAGRGGQRAVGRQHGARRRPRRAVRAGRDRPAAGRHAAAVHGRAGRRPELRRRGVRPPAGDRGVPPGRGDGPGDRRQRAVDAPEVRRAGQADGRRDDDRGARRV